MSAGEPFVSLQLTGTPHPAEGHLATGALLGSDVCVFGLDDGVELPKPAQVEVLLCPVDVSGTSVVERIRPTHIEMASLAASPSARVLLVRIAQPSRYGSPPPSVADLEAAVLAAAQGFGDLRQALRALGVGAELDPAQLQDLLARILDVEREQLERLVVHRLGQSEKDLIRCLLSPKCQPSWPFFVER